VRLVSDDRDESADERSSGLDARFDLAEWGVDERVELVEELIAAGIRHDWIGDELSVADDDAERVERLLDGFDDDVEDDTDDDTDDDPGDDPTGDGPVDDELLDDGADVLEEEFDIDDWSESDRREFSAVLTARGIAHRFDDDALIVAADVADTVEDLLDQFD
jgi:hypothetical protein